MRLQILGDDGGSLDDVFVRHAAYEAQPQGLKETLTLRDASAASTFHFALLTSSGLNLSLRGDGSIIVRDAGGHARFTIPAPTVQEAGASAPSTGHVAYSLSGDTLTLKVDPDWLAQASFPVEVDPTVWDNQQLTCTLSSAAPTASACNGTTLKIGHDAAGTYRTVHRLTDTNFLPAGAAVSHAWVAFRRELPGRPQQHLHLRPGLQPREPGRRRRHDSYTYDNANRLASVTSPKPGSGTSTISYTYTDPVASIDSSKVTIAFPGGLSQESTIDAAGNVISVKVLHGTTVLKQRDYSYLQTIAGTSTVSALIQSMTDEAANTTSYAYGAADRLAEAARVNATTPVDDWLYTYDAASNRTLRRHPVGTGSRPLRRRLPRRRPLPLRRPLLRPQHRHLDPAGSAQPDQQPDGGQPLRLCRWRPDQRR